MDADLKNALLSVLFEVCPYIDKVDSLGGSWFWTAEETRERGYGDSETLGALGLEDAVFEWDMHDEDPYTVLDRFSEALAINRPDLFVEPHFSFLWIVSKS